MFLVRNWVKAAYQQYLVVQGVKCVLYKVLSGIAQVCNVYCTRCADCTVQGVHCVSYRVCSVYLSSKSSEKKEDFDIKSDII